MGKIYLVPEADGSLPFLSFTQALEPKMRKKIEYGLYCLPIQPDYLPPPNVKHFSVERYSSLYEYRARIKQLFRDIFFVEMRGMWYSWFRL